jgi:hypothetical protein
MRSILEKALIALLNEEKDTADALFHDFILERSRQIHESLRQGEDFILDESMETELAIDEMFSEADLSDDMGDAEQVDEFADEEETETDAPAFGAEGDEVAGDEFGGDEEGEEIEGEELPVEDRLTNLESQLQALAAEFDASMNGEEFDGEGEFGAEEEPVQEGTVEIVAHNDGEIDITATTDEDGDDFGADAGLGMDMGADVGADLGADLGDDELSMEDFDDLSESAVDELEKVTVATGDGREQGNGKFKQNTQSIIKSHGVNDRAFKGTPVKINAKEHSGYAAEPAPSTKKLATSAKNVKSKGEEGRTGVKKEGNPAALINKGGEDSGAKSLIGSKKL